MEQLKVRNQAFWPQPAIYWILNTGY